LDEGRRSAAITYSGHSISALGAIARDFPATLREFDAAPPLPANVPLVVLSAATRNRLAPSALLPLVESLMPNRLQMHQEFAKQSTRGSWRIVPESDHLIAASQPDAVVEEIFSIPGVGRMLLAAIVQRDYALVQGGVLVIAILFVLVNIFVDLLYGYLDPRIRLT